MKVSKLVSYFLNAELSMWSLTVLQICLLTFEASYRNKQCTVMLKAQMVRQYYSRIKVQRYICNNNLSTFESFLMLLRHSTRVS